MLTHASRPTVKLSPGAVVHATTTRNPARVSKPVLALGQLALRTPIGPLAINPVMTGEDAATQLRASVAKSFAISLSDVVAEVYTRDPRRMGFGRGDPLLLLTADDLAGAGRPANALTSFLTDPQLSHAHRVTAGPMGGAGACANLSDGHGHTVAQCIWADARTYASFETRYITTQTLQRLMLAARPHIELAPAENHAREGCRAVPGSCRPPFPGQAPTRRALGNTRREAPEGWFAVSELEASGSPC